MLKLEALPITSLTTIARNVDDKGFWEANEKSISSKESFVDWRAKLIQFIIERQEKPGDFHTQSVSSLEKQLKEFSPYLYNECLGDSVKEGDDHIQWRKRLIKTLEKENEPFLSTPF